MNDATLSAPSGESSPFQPSNPVVPALPGFVLLEEIGRGGMGMVYRARDTVLDREVAVKVLLEKYSPDSGVAQRFLDEARITGQLQHPGIPAVYQVGSLPDRRPFLAMKLIKGDTLESRLKAGTVQDALGIFEAVTQAVGYAHSHDVIHRDLKPANIMIGAFGEVQVMDWGLAKVLNPSGTSFETRHEDLESTRAPTEIRTLRDSDGSYTQAGSILGTPAYMSPEQAAGELDKVDQRSDVFGLGGILCFMLTGKPPVTGETGEQVRLNAMRGKMEEALMLLQQSQQDPDVEALCRRCLTFEPQDRFSNANEIVEEVSRLRGATVERLKQAELAQARAEVQAAEQQHRRRVWLGLAVSLLVGLLAAVGLGLWANLARGQAELSRQAEEHARQEAQKKQVLAEQFAQQAQQNELKAIASEKHAREQAAIATAVKDFFLRDLLRLAGPRQQLAMASELKSDPEIKVRDLVLRASRKIDDQFVDQPLIEAEVREMLGSTLWDLGQPALAVPHFERCLVIMKPLLGPEHPLTVRMMENLMNSYDLIGRQENALKLAEDVLRITMKNHDANDLQVLSKKNSLAFCYAAVNRHQDALKLYQEVLDQQTRQLGPDHNDTLSTMNNLSLTYAALNRQEDTLKMREAAYELARRRYGTDHLSTSTFQHNLGRTYSSTGRHSDAIRMHQQGLEIRQSKLGMKHRETYWSMIVLGEARNAAEAFIEAESILREAVQGLKSTVGPGDTVCLWGMSHLAFTLRRLGKKQEELQLREEIVLQGKKSQGAEHPDTIRALKILAQLYTETARHGSAQRIYQQLVECALKQQGRNHEETIWSQMQLADANERAGNWKEAIQLDKSILLQLDSGSVEQRRNALHRLARRLASHQEHTEALNYFEQLMELQLKEWGLCHPRSLQTRGAIVTSLLKSHREDQALLLIQQTWSEVEAGGKLKQQDLAAPLLNMLIERAAILQRRKEIDGYRANADLFESILLTSSGSYYHAARLRSVLAGLYQQSQLAEKETLAREASEQSMSWIRKSIAAGYKQRTGLTKNPDFMSVRSHPEFQKLVDSLPVGSMLDEMRDILTIPGLQQAQQDLDLKKLLDPLWQKIPESKAK